jgi:tRNA wybutosine-synthesizing protein 1
MLSPALKQILQKQKYKIVGKNEHSGVKLCHWMRQKLLFNRPCYKEVFYGIKTHRCLQFTPTINQCTQKCLFCWRYQGFSETDFYGPADEPEEILDNAIKAQRLLVTGFKGDQRVNMDYWHEAQEPNQVAISLSGEPTLYPLLGDFIELCHKRGMTTFLVSNGTRPDIIEKLDPLPTQLYISVTAPNEEIYKKLCVPISRERINMNNNLTGKKSTMKPGWSTLLKTLELLPSLDTRTVIRHTLVDGWNLGWVDEYAKLIEKADPMFIEPKSYVFVGYSRTRMNLKNMARHDKIKEFSLKLAEQVNYELVNERQDSRVVLLAKPGANSKIE